MKTNLEELASSKGGKCLGLSPRNDSKKSKYIWQCSNNHTWEARADSVLRGTWCPICANLKLKDNIEQMVILAQEHGGECLSKNYVNSKTPLVWKCKKGHIFKTTPEKVKQGHWCWECGRVKQAFGRRTTFQEIQSIAKANGGRCLSLEYDPKYKLQWECSSGHVWYADLHNVNAGHWCPICRHKNSGRKRLTIDEMKELAKSKGGQCLSESYENSDMKLTWMCEKGHVWQALPLSVKKGSWCPTCAGNEVHTIEMAQKLAVERGGVCLSLKYEGVHKKLLWQCAEGHQWFANYANVSFGRWCPECSSGIGERICRAYFEQIFGKQFPKSRPPWLINQDGNQMELDGYCHELALAFEHQGQQHFRQISYFHNSLNQLEKRKADDKQKIFLCKDHGIILIEVPSIPDYLRIPKVQRFILEQCKKMDIDIPANVEKIRVNLVNAFSPTNKEKLQAIVDIAFEHGGECLSTELISSTEKLRFKCENGHEWETIPRVIAKGHWCPVCSTLQRAIARRLTINDMDKIAAENGGRCISREYINANTHLLWECKEGHQWKAIPNSIKRGSWCPVCSKIKRLG